MFALPKAEEMNPLLGQILNDQDKMKLQHHENNNNWEPIKEKYVSEDAWYLTRRLESILDKVHSKISMEELEARTNTPQYFVPNESWSNLGHLTGSTLRGVARLPRDLLMLENINEKTKPEVKDRCRGYLWKKGENLNRGEKRRYMVLLENGNLYYFKKQVKNVMATEKELSGLASGKIECHKVMSFQPSAYTKREFGIDLVTASRTWVFAAESEMEYSKWLEGLCCYVPFDAVATKYQRMLKLQDGNAIAQSDVRLALATEDTVGEIVQHVFDCYERALDALPLKKHVPEDYFLKVSGFRDYFINRDTPFCHYQHVRNCLLTKHTIRLTMVHKSEIAMRAQRSLSMQGSQYRYLNATNCKTEIRKTGISSSAVEWDIDEDTSTVYEENNDKAKQMLDRLQENSIGYTSDYKRPLRFCLIRLLNVPNYTLKCEKDNHNVVFVKKGLPSTKIKVRIDLNVCGYHTPLHTIETDIVHLHVVDNYKYAADLESLWIDMPIFYALLPHSAMLVFTIYAEDETCKEYTKIASTGMYLFNLQKELVQGVKYLSLLNNLYDAENGPFPQAVSPTAPLLHVQFEDFPKKILFQWKHRIYINPLLKQENVFKKCDWLSKLGSNQYLSRWKRRYFVLLHDKVCIRYYTSDNAQDQAPTGEINLEYAVVSDADEFNRLFTTSAINPGTRKERQTWCFKICCPSNGREYVLSAETKQQRQEWLDAILDVIDGHTNDAAGFEQDPSLQDFADKFEDKLLLSTARQNELKTVMSAARSHSSSEQSSVLDSLWEQLMYIMENDPLYEFSQVDRRRVWDFRRDFMEYPFALPCVLKCVNWMNPDDAKEAIALMKVWTPAKHRASYMVLLNKEYAHEEVRNFAVKQLRVLQPTDLKVYLPQLVQALKFEPYHASNLAALLIEYAIEAPCQFGFEFFWYLKVESHDEQYRERYAVILNSYLEVCGRKQSEILKLQDRLFSADGIFARICSMVKGRKKDGMEVMRKVMQDELGILNELLPNCFQLPLDSRIEVNKIVISKCRVMDSAKLPLWLEFENAEPGGDPVIIIFKSGDDVRQDCVTLQLIRLMDEIWRESGLDLSMEPYRCVATSPMTGLLQVVTSSVTTAMIHKRYGGVFGAYNETCFLDWIKDNNPEPKKLRNAINLFARSCAGYCVATHVLGIGDRHNDNIMVSCIVYYKLVNDYRCQLLGDIFILILDTF